MIVKVHEIAPDPELAAKHIGQQLDLGVSGIMFVSASRAPRRSSAGSRPCVIRLKAARA